MTTSRSEMASDEDDRDAIRRALVDTGLPAQYLSDGPGGGEILRGIEDRRNERLRERLEAAAIEAHEGRWWRVIDPDGSLWCETSDEDEARGSMRPGDRLERQVVMRATWWVEVDDEPCEFCGRTLADGPCASCAEPDPNDEVVAAQSLADMLLRRAGEAAIEASRDFRSRPDDNEGDTDGR